LTSTILSLPENLQLIFDSCSEVLVVGSEYLPSLLAHEAGGRVDTILSHLSHAGSRNEFEVFGVSSLGVEELHGLVLCVVGGDSEWNDVNTVEHSLVVNKELLSVPGVVEVDWLLGVLYTSGVSSSDEVGNSTVNSGGSVPEDFSGSTVVHWGRPDGEDDVFSREGSIINQSLMLVHAFLEWDIIIFAPSTEGVEEEDGVLVSLLLELRTGVLEEEAVTIMEGVADLEGVAGISLLGNNSFFDLLGGKSVLVHAIVPHNLGEEVHLSRDEPVVLVGDVVGHGVVGGEASESSCADLFLSVCEVDGVSNDSDGLSTVDSGVNKGNSLASGEGVLEFSGDILGDGNREHVTFA